MRFLTEKKYDELKKQLFEAGVEFYKKDRFRTLNPVISSLKELNKNTWDKERVYYMIKWLEEYIYE